MRKFALLVLVVVFSGWSSGASAVPIASGLVAGYDFTGNADDVSGNGNHGVVHGAAPTTDRFGNANSAYSFDGVDDFIEPGSHFAGYPEFSQLIWVKPASPVSGGETRIIQAGVGGIYLDTTLDELIFEMLFDRVGGTANGNSYSTRFIYQTPASVAGNDWYHLALIGHSNNDLDVYINGALAHSGAGVTDDGQNSNYENSLIGAGHPHQLSPGVNFKFFSGDIDDVYVYDRALSPAEVQTLYSTIPEPSTALLLGVGLAGLGMRRRQRTRRGC